MSVGPAEHGDESDDVDPDDASPSLEQEIEIERRMRRDRADVRRPVLDEETEALLRLRLSVPHDRPVDGGADPGAALAQEATTALRKLDHAGRMPPAATDRFAGSADVLDELARAVEALGRAVQNTSGQASEVIGRQAQVLSRLITEHRNDLLRERPGPAPAAGRAATVHHRRPPSLARRLMAREWADRQVPPAVRRTP